MYAWKSVIQSSASRLLSELNRGGRRSTSPPAKTLTIGTVLLLTCVAVACVSLVGVERVGRCTASGFTSPFAGLAMMPFVGVCRSFPLWSDMSADTADHGFASCCVMSLYLTWRSCTAFAVVYWLLHVALYSTSFGSRRYQFWSSVAIRALPMSPLAVETVLRDLAMSPQIESDSCHRRRRSRRIQLSVPSLAVASAIIRTLSTFQHR